MEQSQPALFSLNGAAVRRAGRDILSVDSFQLAEGEHLCLLGPNGSGKSTFVKLITREILPLHHDDAPVRFRGNPRATLASIKQQVGVVSSSMQDQIAVHLPSADVVAGGLYGSLGIPRFAEGVDQARQRANEAMDLLGVRHLAEQDIMTLSSGQARRVLIARALIHDPSVLVFDEPCTGLDPEGMYYVRKSMRTLASLGKTIILITHYPEDIIPEIQRVVLIKQGTIFADGAKNDLLTNATLTSLFDVPLQISRNGEYFSLVSEY